MRLIKNIGTDRVLDQISPHLQPQARVDAASDGLSLFAFDALANVLSSAGPTRLLLSNTITKPPSPGVAFGVAASEADPLAGAACSVMTPTENAGMHFNRVGSLPI